MNKLFKNIRANFLSKFSLKTKAARLFNLLLLFSIFLLSCHFPVASDTEAENWVIEQCIKNTDNFEQLVQCIPLPKIPAAKKDTLVNNTNQVVNSEEEVDDEGEAIQFSCQTEEYEGVKNFEEQIVLDPTVDVVYPGALVQGQTIPSGHLSPIPAPRNSGKIIIEGINFSSEQSGKSLEGTGYNCNNNSDTSKPKYSCSVDSVRQSYIMNATNAILKQNISGTAANVYMSIHEVFSFQQIKASLGIQVGSSSSSGALSSAGKKIPITGSIDASFEMTSKESTTVMEFVQSYYTIVFEPPPAVRNFFTSDYNSKLFKRFLGPSNPPGYISQVSYGRKIYFFIFSKYDFLEVKAALEASVKIPVPVLLSVGIGASVEGSYAQTLEESSMIAVLIGGNPEDGALAITSSNAKEGMENFIKSGSLFNHTSPGAPISYTIKWLSSNETARTSLYSSYQKRICSPVDPNLQIGTFKTTESMPSARLAHSSWLTVNSHGTVQIYVSGGKSSESSNSEKNIFVSSIDPDNGSLSPWEEVSNYDVSTILEAPFVDGIIDAAWSQSTVNDNVFLSNHSSFVYNAKVYTFAGDSCYGTTLSVTNCPSPGVSAYAFQTALNNDGNIDSSWNLVRTSSPSQLLKVNRTKHKTIVYNNYVYIVGGSDGTSSKADIYYSKLDNSGNFEMEFKKNATSMNTAREEFDAFVYNNKLVILGGLNSNIAQASIEYATINNDGSLSAFSLQEPDYPDGMAWSSFAVKRVRDKIFFFGGKVDNVLASKKVYFAKINDNASIGEIKPNSISMNNARYAHSVEYSRQRFYIIGGAGRDENGVSTTFAGIEIAPLLVQDKD